MNQNICTTPEQGKRLIACGVDPSTADMCYLYWDESGEQLSREEYLEIFNESFLDGRIELVPKDFGDYDHSYSDDSPAWSLGRILEILPPRILVNDAWYECQLCRCVFGYEVRYHSEVFKDPFGCLCTNPIEGSVEAIEWLTEEKYKLNEIKQ
ncbi:MAG: hypothetical protein K2N25_03410 [Muribaculaceae bacterium]|nr:hypothetical protein [Muribaculaceae bacterium]